MENKKILLIGFGNIGVRYYEGILKSNKNFQLYIFDKNKKKYLKKKKKYVYFLSSLNEAKKISNLFLIVIATTAADRGTLLKRLNLKPKYWIIEKPLGSSIKQINLVEKKFKFSKNAYINMPRENWTIYKKLKKLFIKSKSKMKVNGTNWNLVSNCFHFLRLFEWINDSKIKSFNFDKINSWYSSKRKKYYEADGLITAQLYNGSTCSLISKRTFDNKKKYVVNLYSNKNFVKFNEMSGNLKINNKNLKYKIPLVSEEMNSYFEKFILKKKVSLPEVKTQLSIQKKVLKEFQSNWSKKFKKKNRLNIT